MGEIVSVHDEQIGRSVAIKRLHGRDVAPGVIARFLREARIQARLEHPAIVPMHELHDAGDEPYFVMKKVAGVPLQDAIAERPRTALLRAFVEVCLAIEFAHTHGVIHRDLKPANILLGDFGEVYVVDWGIARVVSDAAIRADFADIDGVASRASDPGTIVGTPGYMSPEQIRGDAAIDGRSDVYALGCILFEILAGKRLHPRGQALVSALEGVDARASVHRDVPPELDEACVKATAVEPDARFTSARALADAVQRYLDGDRDLALRRDLARADLDRARDALACNDRAEALRAGSRAIALDPHAREAAELVARLMLEPPEQAPPEVEQELLAADLADMRRQASRTGLSGLGLGLLLLVTLTYFAGLHDTWYIATLVGMVVLAVVSTRIVVDWPVNWLVWRTIAANTLVLVVIALATTPILIAPGVAVLTAGLLAARPRLRPIWLIYALSVAAMLVPWGLEVIGYLPRTIDVTGDGLVLHLATTRLDGSVALAGLALWVVYGPALALILTRSIFRDRSRMERSLHVQAWQLRQLVPRAPTDPQLAGAPHSPPS
jgi:serine/threonine-protein kinase